MLEFISHILHIKKKTEVKNGSLIFKHPTNTGAVNNQEGGEYYDYYSETSKNPKAVMFQSPEEENPNGAVQGIAYLDFYQRRDQLPFSEVDPSTASFDKASSHQPSYDGAKEGTKSQPNKAGSSHESFYTDDNYYGTTGSNLPCPQYPHNDIRNIDPADFPEYFEDMKNKPQKRTASQGSRLSKTTGRSRTTTVPKKPPAPKGCVLGPNFGRPAKQIDYNIDMSEEHYVFCNAHSRLVNKHCGSNCPHCAHVEQYRPYVPDTRPMPLNFFDPPSTCCCVRRTDQFGRYTKEALQWTLYSE
ncbi:uncharacterized protein LOC142352897 [Convolutriloba macropyga]|uniref:uncharacterized protein LOC142352897 n=1 Tax=Convolutriloba macropyga TaxID=536237 RepID=UPI003F5289DD